MGLLFTQEDYFTKDRSSETLSFTSEFYMYQQKMEFSLKYWACLGSMTICLHATNTWLEGWQWVDGRWSWSVELQYRRVSMLALLTTKPWISPAPHTESPAQLYQWPLLGCLLSCYWDYAWNSPSGLPSLTALLVTFSCASSFSPTNYLQFQVAFFIFCPISAPPSPSLCILSPPPLHFSLSSPAPDHSPLVILSAPQVQLSPLHRCLPDVHLQLRLCF